MDVLAAISGGGGEGLRANKEYSKKVYMGII